MDGLGLVTKGILSVKAEEEILLRGTDYEAFLEDKVFLTGEIQEEIIIIAELEQKIDFEGIVQEKKIFIGDLEDEVLTGEF